MADTAYNTNFAPYAAWSTRQAPVPATTHNLPASVPASGSIQSSLIVSEGFSLISIGVTSSQAGTLSIQRYLDAGGTVVQGAVITANLLAASAANLDILDGKPFASFKITLTNATATIANLTNLAVLLQASDLAAADSSADGSRTLTAGNTAQTLFGGVTPVNGFGVYNPDPSNDVWISDTATAAINGLGSIRVVANGGGYETPQGYRPQGPVSVIGAVTGQKITARRW